MDERSKIIEDYGTVIKLEIIKHFLGDYLGSGTARDVFSFNVDLVVKIEQKSFSFQNVNEYNITEYLKGTEWGKWIAPIHSISSCGIMVLQTKAIPLKSLDQLPDKIPNFFTDLKLSNYGYIGKQFVAIDYGLTNLEYIGLNSVKLVKVNKKKWNQS